MMILDSGLLFGPPCIVAVMLWAREASVLSAVFLSRPLEDWWRSMLMLHTAYKTA